MYNTAHMDLIHGFKSIIKTIQVVCLYNIWFTASCISEWLSNAKGLIFVWSVCVCNEKIWLYRDQYTTLLHITEVLNSSTKNEIITRSIIINIKMQIHKNIRCGLTIPFKSKSIR